MLKTMRRGFFTTTLMASSCLFAVPALAQTAPADPQKAPDGAEVAAGNGEVVVTGTRIARPDLELASPVNVISAAEIGFRQPGTAEELIRDLPAVRPSIGPGVNNGSDGSATIDLRGIGTNRTLVLLDNRRVVPFGLDGLTDTNVIPIALVERVDVVTGGASSVYGADAVAGVVNFITKRNFAGLDLSVNYRAVERGGAERFRANLLVGANFDDNRGNVVLGIDYTDASPLLHTQRPISAFPISSTTGLFQGATAAQVTIFASPTNAQLGLPASTFGAVVNPTTGLLQAATANDTYNTNNGTYFQTPLNRINVYAAGRYEINEHLEFYSTAFFNRNEVRLQLAPSGTFGNTYQLALNNPFLPAGIRNQICTARNITMANCNAAAVVQGGPGTAGYIETPVIAQRRFTEYGPRGNPITSQVFQIQAGIRGKITDTIKYDFSAQYGETTQNQVRQNWGSFSRVQQALRAYRVVGGAANGTIRCADTTNNCVPLNLFGPNGSITQDQLDFIDLDALINRKTQLAVFTGSISGDLFGLTSPFASHPIAFSVGGEYRDLSAASQPDASSQIQGEVLGTGARTPPDRGAYTVSEGFIELAVPLVEDKPFFYKLSLEGGIRFSDYSTTGASTTWKVGGTYEPFAGFKFRGTYQRAVRSPNIQELFQSAVQGLGNLTVDPCQGTGLSAGLAALCVATGAPQATIGQIPAPTSGQINVTTAGNNTLNVERATTFTVGGVFTPRFVKGLSVTIDYFNIRVNNAITQPAQADILNGCYSAALNPTFANNAFCQLIRRNPLTGSLNGAGETPGVILSFSNLGVIQTAGIDFTLSQRFDLDDFGLKNGGTLTLGFNGTLLDYYNFQATPNAINRDCTGYYSANGCTNPRAKFRSNTRLTYSREWFDISLLWTRVSAVELEPFLATAIQPVSTPQPGGPNPTTVLPAFRQIDAYDLFDLSLRVMPLKNLELTMTIDNLLDRQPPNVGSGVGGTAFNSGNTFPTIYDPIGRAFTMGARIKF
ncbi:MULTISPECIES: TonB-dependent receptor plug domain-containing protein [Sphingomonas]|uniref:TonB-dependent receptor plug domain-containing protein n=1 Tax=Sphingomonas TaxID=13687 RepID=UPI000B147747|nr:TonB-dependent receptor [Sphingomonas sp. CCH10-B3]